MVNSTFFFAAQDSTFGSGLWFSDGTSGGTFEIGGLKDQTVAGSSRTGLSPSSVWLNDMIILNGKLTFAGTDANSSSGLWVSDGTAGGTVEIGGLSDSALANVSASGLHPFDFTLAGSHAYFKGTDKSNTVSLWVTDGTTSGTTELGGLRNSGIGGVYFAGLQTQFMAAFGDKVLFDGHDANNFQGLWISDGTLTGTFELGGLNGTGVGAGSGRYLGHSASLGDKIIFNWSDSVSSGLWVSDGTNAGTFEIGGVSNQGVSNATSGLGVSFQRFVTLGSQVYFQGSDATGFSTLWMSNGTAAGTQELGGRTGVDFASGSAYQTGLDARDLTVFNGHVIFEGKDVNNNYGLWITDGSGAGTLEIGGASSAGIANAGHNFAPHSFTVIGDKVLFSATDASGQSTLWVTDGTLTGTSEIGGLNNAGVLGAPLGGIAAQGVADGATIISTSFTSNGSYATFTVFGAQGQDLLWVSDGTVAGTHEITQIPGVSTFRYSSITNFTDVFNGTTENDRIVGSNVNDTIFGYAGNDTLNGGLGADQLFGGAGNDTIYYDAADDLANVIGGADVDTLRVLNQAAPTSFDLAAHQFENANVILDDTSGQWWSNISDYFNVNWQRTNSDTRADDGRLVQTTFDVSVGGAGVNWQYVTDYRNLANVLTNQDGVFDSGNTFAKSYDYSPGSAMDGISDELREFTYFFPSVADQQTGRVLNVEGFYDDGRKFTQTNDIAGDQLWTFKTNWYKTDAVTLDFQETRWDDGHTSITPYT